MRYFTRVGTKLSGKRYEAGEAVPADVVTRGMVNDGRIIALPDDGEPAVSGPDAYDPGQHTIDHVVEYAAGHRDQVGAIIAAERAGGDRASLITRLEALDTPERPVGGLPGSHFNLPGEVPGDAPVGEPSDPVKVRRALAKAGDDRRIEVPGDHLSASLDGTLADAIKGAPVGDPSDPDKLDVGDRRELPGDHLTAGEEGDDAARSATREDLGDARTDRMRERAGTDTASDPNPSAPVPGKPVAKTTKRRQGG